MGTDTAAYRGILSDYIISYNSNSNSFTITDKISGRDHTDTLTGIEYFSFTDRTVSSSQYTQQSGSTINSTELYLAQMGVSMQVARNFILANVQNPQVIFNTADQFNLTNQMLADIVGVQRTDVIAYWSSLHFDYSLLG